MPSKKDGIISARAMVCIHRLLRGGAIDQPEFGAQYMRAQADIDASGTVVEAIRTRN
jgi:heptaprenylglyceryl phosphate synthase